MESKQIAFWLGVGCGLGCVLLDLVDVLTDSLPPRRRRMVYFGFGLVVGIGLTWLILKM